MGVKIESNLPKNLLQEAVDLLVKNNLKDLEFWHRNELPKQMKEFNKITE